MTRWQRLPALPDTARDVLIAKALRLREQVPPHHGVGHLQRELDELARSHGVTLRTLYRYLARNRSTPDAAWSIPSGDDEPASERAA